MCHGGSTCNYKAKKSYVVKTIIRSVSNGFIWTNDPIIDFLKFWIVWKFWTFFFLNNFEIFGASLRSRISPVIPPCIGFRLCHFRCKEFYPLVLWIWNQNIAISTILGTSSHITDLVCYTYSHWFFNHECQQIFGKQTGYIF
jgi:hypothetical protein